MGLTMHKRSITYAAIMGEGGLSRGGGKHLQGKSMLEFAGGPSLGLGLLVQSLFSANNVFEFGFHGGHFCFFGDFYRK